MYKPHSSQIKYYNNFGATSAVFFTHQSTSRDPVFKSREVSLSRQQQPISQIVYSGQQFQQTPIRKHFNNTESIIRPPSPSSKKEQLQQEWNKIIDKTKNLQDNLVQLKNSVSNNLKKPTDIRYSKESTQSGINFFDSQSSRIKPTLQKINTVSKIKNPFQAKKTVNKIFGHIEARLNLKIVDFLGRGKFSEVHLAVDQRSGFVFALKMIKKSTVIEFQMQDQLIREMQIQSKLSHTNIVKMYGQSYDETYVYMMLEYCNGGELFQHQYKQKDRKFIESVASAYIFQILNSIQYMHNQGFMHRDMKTENILLSLNQIKLCDLGCVREIPTNNNRRNTFCGTVDYIAPEVITEDGYDQRCDIWQIAVLAFELVHGQTPFTEQPRDDEVIMEKILQNNFTIPQYFSPHLKDFVNQGLQGNPDKRISLEQMLKHPWIVKNHKQMNVGYFK